VNTLFISDLHLEESRPEITELFLHFLREQASKADALYILGDFFEVWIGDDHDAPLHQRIIAVLRNLTDSGIPVYLMQGNRDFLLGEQFAKASGCRLLTEPCLIDLYGTRTLLMHGDTLCTEDIRYLKFRSFVRNPFFQKLFLSLPLRWRKKIAQYLRKASEQHTGQAAKNILDTTPAEVERVMEHHQATLLIHGHTHRPSIEFFSNNKKRIVLSDWDKTGHVLICSPDGELRMQQIHA
jgi:UDP-2,3-diacylglucosamine hydrolase